MTNIRRNIPPLILLIIPEGFLLVPSIRSALCSYSQQHSHLGIKYGNYSL